jgi:hypothetical protein
MDDQIRQKILTLLNQHRIMTIATLRPDGWPSNDRRLCEQGFHALLPLWTRKSEGEESSAR